MSEKKYKVGDSLTVNNRGKINVGVVKKRYVKQGIAFHDILLENGAFLEAITGNNEMPVYIKKLTPLSGQVIAAIDPDKYNYEIPNTPMPSDES